MNLANADDTIQSHSSCNPLASAVDAEKRSKEAYDLHQPFFDSDPHLDRLEILDEIFKSYLRRTPSFRNFRGLGKQAKKPFEVAKIAEITQKQLRELRESDFFEVIDAMGNVEYDVNKRREIIVRIYPV